MNHKHSIYLIDGNAYIYRAYHAISPLSNKDGLPTHATFGFTNILLRVLKEKNPEFVAVAFDTKGPTFRHRLYKEYKANRPPMPDDLVVQIPYIKEVVQAYNIPIMEMSDVEADDLLAAATKVLEAAGCRVTIVSGDKDLLQLVSETVSLWDPMQDKLMDPAAVKAKYNVEPAELNDLFALIGDKSDNVPGVPGIGPKTAEKLINAHGTLEKLFEQLDQVSSDKMRQKLNDHQEDAFLSKELIRLKNDLPVPATPEEYRQGVANQERLVELYTLLGFSRLLKEQEGPARSLATDEFHLINNQQALERLTTDLQGCEMLVVDTETSSLDPLSADLVGLSLCRDQGAAYYIPISHQDQEGNTLTGQLPLQTVLEALGPLLTNPQLPKLGHNLKFDYAVLKQQGLTMAGPLWDTMIASYLLEPGRRTHKLDTLCQEEGLKLTSFQEVTKNAKQEDSFRRVALEEAKNYSCEDVAAALILWRKFRPQLDELGLWELFDRVETCLIPVLAEMEANGIRINATLLQELSDEFGSQLDCLTGEIHQLAGQTFNIGSPKQLAEILFEKLQLPHGRKTKTGYSTDMKVLEKLARVHDLPRLIIEHRNLSKLKSTYVDKLPTMVHPLTGRIHTSFNQTVTATGRLSSSDPNLQNIPIRTEEGQRIREAFIPDTGCAFISADYSQIDLRVLAHYSEDEALVEAFCQGQDIHQQTAAEIFRVNAGLITGQMRRVAKSINFGIVYGMSAFGLAGQLDISRKEAATFIERYFDHYKGVRLFMEEIVKQAGKDGFVTTLLGRRRVLPDINSPNKNRREFAERTALNTPIQGTAADLIKIASIETARRLRETGLGARILLQIHDELILEVPEDQLQETGALVKETMETVFPLKVPLLVNIATGNSLAKA